MNALFEIKEIDRAFYEKHLRAWLPEKIIDIHTHVWLKRFNEKQRAKPKRAVAWPAKVADENPVEHLAETYRLMFPDKAVMPLIFTGLVSEKNLDKANAYVAQAAREKNFPALVFSHPQWSAPELARKIAAGGFLGAKSYLTLAPAWLPAAEIRIFDFFPPHQLELLNRQGLLAMLHIPRNLRLRDPVNLAQLLEIEERYPDIRLIVAHVGRAYCPGDIGPAFKILARTKRMCFDISANTNAAVFRRLLETIGPQRVLFGSDLPIARMRLRRVCEKGNYVNLVPRGMYGNVSGDKHMRELGGKEAARLTFFMYEELDAFRRAARAAGLTAADLKDVFYNNARRILKR